MFDFGGWQGGVLVPQSNGNEPVRFFLDPAPGENGAILAIDGVGDSNGLDFRWFDFLRIRLFVGRFLLLRR